MKEKSVEEFAIEPMTLKDLPQVLVFCDRYMGENYYTLSSLTESFTLSQKDGRTCSFCLWNEQDELIGVRISYAPGIWVEKMGDGVTPNEWKVEAPYVAYFKSLFLSKRYQKRGLGPKLSDKSIEVLKEFGAKAVVCHSALDSPGNSSQKYLRKIGFEPIKIHPNFWSDIDYSCTFCKKKPCVCTAEEMIKYL